MQWKSALPKKPRHQQLCQFPWLILPYDDESKMRRRFFRLLEKKVYHLELHEARGKFVSWILLWLVGYYREEWSIASVESLHHQGEEYAIVQPQGTIDYLDEYFIQQHFVYKIILSSSPTSSIHDDYMAVAIYGEVYDLAFCRRGDKKWTAISTSDYWYKDIIFHEEKLYALTGNKELVVCDMGSTPKGAKILVKPLSPLIPWADRYLVAAGGELLMIERCGDARVYKYPELSVCHSKTTGFNAYKVDLSKRRPRWSKLNCLRDKVLLLGDISSLSVSPHNFPNCKGNCIYYTDEIVRYHNGVTIGGDYDIGVFNLENKIIKEMVGFKGNTKRVWHTPVWVLPYLP